MPLRTPGLTGETGYLMVYHSSGEEKPLRNIWVTCHGVEHVHHIELDLRVPKLTTNDKDSKTMEIILVICCH